MLVESWQKKTAGNARQRLFVLSGPGMLKRFKSVCKRIMLIIAIRGARSSSSLMSNVFGFHCVVVGEGDYRKTEDFG